MKRRRSKYKKRNYLIFALLLYLIEGVMIACVTYISGVKQLVDTCEKQKSYFHNNFSMVVNEIVHAVENSSWEDKYPECIEKTLDIWRTEDLWSDSKVGDIMIRDMQTGEIVYQQKPAAILQMITEDEIDTIVSDQKNETDSYRKKPQYDYYYCDDECLEQIAQLEKAGREQYDREREAFFNGHGGGSGYSAGYIIYDYYIKDRMFYPGRTEYYMDGSHHSEGKYEEFLIKKEWNPQVMPGKEYEHRIVPAERTDIQDKRFWARPIIRLIESYSEEMSTQEIEEQSRILSSLRDYVYPGVSSYFDDSNLTCGLFDLHQSSISLAAASIFSDSKGKAFRIEAYEKLKGFHITPWWYDLEVEKEIILLALVVFLPILIALVLYLCGRFRLLTDGYRELIMDSMAHDLKSPLMAISGYAENLRDLQRTPTREENILAGDVKSEDEKEINQYYADQIMDSVSYMNMIVTRNLEILRFDQERRKLARSRLNFRELFEEALKRYQGEIDKRNLQITIEGEMEECADAELLKIAVENLVTNAIHYTPDGGRIEVILEKRKFEIRNTANLEFKGNLKKLWEPLVRGNESRTGGGTGMGLAITSGIFDRHAWRYQLKYDREQKIFRCIVKIPLGFYF